MYFFLSLAVEAFRCEPDLYILFFLAEFYPFPRLLFLLLMVLAGSTWLSFALIELCSFILISRISRSSSS